MRTFFALMHQMYVAMEMGRKESKVYRMTQMGRKGR